MDLEDGHSNKGEKLGEGKKGQKGEERKF